MAAPVSWGGVGEWAIPRWGIADQSRRSERVPAPSRGASPFNFSGKPLSVAYRRTTSAQHRLPSIIHATTSSRSNSPASETSLPKRPQLHRRQHTMGQWDASLPSVPASQGTSEGSAKTTTAKTGGSLLSYRPSDYLYRTTVTVSSLPPRPPPPEPSGVRGRRLPQPSTRPLTGAFHDRAPAPNA